MNAGTNAVTFTGAAVPTVNNPVTAGRVNVTNGSVNLNANVNSPLAIDTGTATITGNVGGALTVANGTLDLASNQILSMPTRLGAGLREMKVTGSAFNEVTPNSGTVAKLGPVMAQLTTGWGSNETYVYTGQIFIPDNNGDGTGSFALAENFDDSVRIDIDGVTACVTRRGMIRPGLECSRCRLAGTTLKFASARGLVVQDLTRTTAGPRLSASEST